MKTGVLGVAALVTSTFLTTAAIADYSITILHINDLHSRIEPINKYDSTCGAEDDAEGKCFGGIARIKTMIDQRRDALYAEGRNTIVMDAGDQFQGSLFYTTYKGTAAVEFMNDIGFDVMAVGNHEFDDGPNGLANFVDAAQFPVVSGNIDVENEPSLKGKVSGVLILEKGGEKIGIVSALAEDTDETSAPGDGVRFIQAEDYLKGAVEALEAAGINKIIAVNHTGLNRDVKIATSVPGIDVIVGGHSHTLLSNTQDRASGPYPVMVENPRGQMVPIVQAYAYGKFLGELEVTFDDDGNVVSAQGEPILLDASVAANEAFTQRVGELGAPIEVLKAKVIGSTNAAIDGARTSCRAGECQMGNLVADAMLDRVRDQGIQIAIQNGGGLRSSIDAGDVTMGEVLTVLPFQNTLSTFQLKGADIIAALENGVSQVEDGAGRFPQVAGLKFSWTRKKTAGEGRILVVEVMEDGAWVTLDPEKTYGVVSNNYMRSGGDGYDVFASNAISAYDFGPGLEKVLADYIASHQGYAPYTDGRISEQ
ncbi:5'-nucleotidase [Roseibium hamelinense]|uniref:5'-nucleotidase n=1 Tax=Roseibium hamelinense TaxID=150831 RepID=A0A562SUN6_9HYPH|nr:bifunctional metallophosphatase/5'-nucleotidase [Roseibium hamelinense]MTI42122.1 multifunctional 2',3'-cyclic-nucleotide 2'-phosphodiesterase/5'-nucleotidase/3'-nucleotidase [Roseibium hamelinense]TWI84724.1 5'-nucleotidase [Roseibium hamelinense]